MCGRYQLSLPGLELENCLGATPPTEYRPRFNIAPTQDIPIVRLQMGQRRIVMVRWGLIPSWSTEGLGGKALINARSETADSKPSFRDALRWGRCLIPATGFYEWRRTGPTKTPHLIRVKSSKLFTLAGIGTRWMGRDGPIDSAAILTVDPQGALGTLHDRMPVILDEQRAARWLDPTTTKAEILGGCMPWPGEDLQITQVSTWVNAVTHDDARCEQETPTQPSLF
ncbi:MAG: SOS response-associated peptidase [Myxococcota bacterium]|nr:SOS response-associated peptidase [Myxococcota bacterium]